MDNSKINANLLLLIIIGLLVILLGGCSATQYVDRSTHIEVSDSSKATITINPPQINPTVINSFAIFGVISAIFILTLLIKIP